MEDYMGKMLPVQARTVCFVATRDEHPQAWPGTGGYKPDQVQLLLFHNTDGKVHVHHTPDCFSIFNCLMLFNSKKNHRHFFCCCCCCKRTLPACEGGKHKNIRCLFVNITSSERFQGLGLFLKESIENKREGEKCDKRNQ